MTEKWEPFDKYTNQYESWFEQHKLVYESEVNAVRALLPSGGEKIEIGVGSGRFAVPLDIQYGLDPSMEMLRIAKRREIQVHRGVAEWLPYFDSTFNCAVMITTLCFLSDIHQAFQEVCRVLKPQGIFVIGFVAKESPIGQSYLAIQSQDVFYQVANFYSTPEVISHLQMTGFTHFESAQTLFDPLEEITTIEPVKFGYGEGSFVVLRAIKNGSGNAKNT